MPCLLRKATRPVGCLAETPMVDGVVTRNANENPAFAFRRHGEAGRRFHFCRALAEVWISPRFGCVAYKGLLRVSAAQSRLCSGIPGAFVRAAKQIVRTCGRWRGHRRDGCGVRRFLTGGRAPDRQPPHSPNLANRHAKRVNRACSQERPSFAEAVLTDRISPFGAAEAHVWGRLSAGRATRGRGSPDSRRQRQYVG